MRLTQQQVQQIIDGRPDGTNPVDVLNGLVNRGYEIEGVNMAEARAFAAQTKQEERGFLGKALEARKQSREENTEDLQQARREFVGAAEEMRTGIERERAEFLEGDQKLGSTLLQMSGEAARGFSRAFGALVKGGLKSVLPQQTENRIKEGLQKLGEFAGPIAMEQYEKSGLKEAWESLTPEQQENLKASGEVGLFIFDVATIGGGEVAAKSAVKTARANIDDVIKQAKSLVPEKISTGTFEIPGRGTFKAVADVAEDLAPKASQLRDQQFARAFKFAPSDIANLEARANIDSVGEWAFANDLIKDTPEETIDAMRKFKLDNYEAVRNATSVVPDKYSFADIPAAEAVVDDLIRKVNSVIDEGKYPNVNTQFTDVSRTLKDKAIRFNNGEADLLDIQYIKSASDDINSFYKRNAGIKEGLSAQQGADLNGQLRRFIEDRVEEYNPEIPIRELNKNVMLSRGLTDAAIARAPKFETQSIFELGDYAIFGAGQISAPGVGFALLAGKKILESSPMRLRAARFLAGRAKSEFKPTEIKKIKEIIGKELGDAIDIIE